MMKFQINIIVLINVIFLLTLVEGSHYRVDYEYSQEAEGWLKFHRVPDIFTSAFLRCHAEGAVLASPLNEALRKAMMKLHEASGDDCGIFTGIHATFSKGDYASVEGVPIASIPVTWAPSEPDNYKNSEDCTVMLQNGTLADVQCNDTYPYICYREKTNARVMAPCGTVDLGYTFDVSTGSCYKFHRVGLTWRKAYMTCLAEGGYLAIINNAAEAQVLKDLYTKSPPNTIVSQHKNVASIGFYDIGDRLWFTVHGQTLEEAGYDHFAPGEPNNLQIVGFSNENCGSILPNDKPALLNDVPCDLPLAFICEMTPNSLIERSH